MKLWYSYLKELKLSSKGFYFYMEILMTVIILVLLLFVIPEEMDNKHDEYIMFDMPVQAEEYYVNIIKENDIDGKSEIIEIEIEDKVINVELYVTEESKLHIFDNEEDLIDATEADRPSIGAKITWDKANSNYKYDYYLQGYESEKLRNLYTIIHVKDLEALVAKGDSYEVKVLETGHERLNTKQNAVPALITFNGSLMGLFIIAAYIFLDKQEGVIKAYAVTASHVWEYLLSKALTLMTVTTITTFIIIVPVMGTQPTYWAMLILLLTSAFFSSAIGLVISSFFDNMTQSFGAIYGVMILFMLPAIEYFIPSWNPLWIKFIPIYYLIQGFKETIMVNGDMTYVMLSSAGFLLMGIIFFLYANHRFKKNLAV